jgi:hypothetical protein
MTSPGPPTVADRRTPVADSLELMDTDLERLRDRLTVEHLLTFARSVDPGARPISYQRDWWDGSAATGCLLVEIHGKRHRVVNTGAGTPILLPAWRVRARRALGESRRASSEPLPAGSANPSDNVSLTTRALATPQWEPPPLPRATPSAERRTVVQDGDYLVCRYADCGGLLPLDGEVRDGEVGCPSCRRH